MVAADDESLEDLELLDATDESGKRKYDGKESASKFQKRN